jgi:hypothetical protein
MQQRYELNRDPVFFAMAAFFALLVTALPAVLGQLRFMPLLQAASLTAYLLIPLRKRDLRSALILVFLWLALSMLAILVLTWFVPEQMERAFESGFLHRAAVSEWYYAGSPLPASFATQPVPSLVEIAGILLGSLLTGGLVGAWFLVKMANLAAFSAGSLLLTMDSLLLLPIALPLWSVLQIAGAGGLVVLLAEPLISGRFAAGMGDLFRVRRRPLVVFGAIYLLGLILELILPAFWHFTPV